MNDAMLTNVSSGLLAASVSAAGIFSAVLMFALGVYADAPKVAWLSHQLLVFIMGSAATVLISCASTLLSLACLLGYHKFFYPMVASFLLLISGIVLICIMMLIIFW